MLVGLYTIYICLNIYIYVHTVIHPESWESRLFSSNNHFLDLGDIETTPFCGRACFLFLQRMFKLVAVPWQYHVAVPWEYHVAACHHHTCHSTYVGQKIVVGTFLNNYQSFFSYKMAFHRKWNWPGSETKGCRRKSRKKRGARREAAQNERGQNSGSQERKGRGQSRKKTKGFDQKESGSNPGASNRNFTQLEHNT